MSIQPRAMGSLRHLAGATALLVAAMGLAVVLAGPRVHFVGAPQPPVKFVAKLAVHAIPKIIVAAAPIPAPAEPSHLPENAVLASPLPPETMTVDPALAGTGQGAVAERVIAKVPPALAPYFDVYLYVSKAADGPWAQHLFYFKKSGSRLGFVESFAVSTGREADEQYFTATPMGLFELDSSRFMPMAYSAKWNDAEMPWAMFLNYSYRTQMTGVALHAAIGPRELSMIGQRASGGCVRLPLEKADAFFHRFQKEENGLVPVFAFDEARGTTNVAGNVARNNDGRVFLAEGMRVLVVIEDYPGPARSS
jgi:hypothetical protein